MDIQPFRQALLDAVLAAKATQPDAGLHLLYVPELADPLALIGDARRDTALIYPPTLATPPVAPDKERLSRLVTLDAVRVARYLLETDPGLDDPLFEASITQAHAELVLNQRPDAGVGNDEREFSPLSIGGWFISRDSARQLALRIREYSQLQYPNPSRWWVRWANPIYLSALWPTMSAQQRQALLGQATWVAFDTAGRLRRYSADEPAAVPAQADLSPILASRLQPAQAGMLKNVPLVRDLLARWQALLAEYSHPLPDNAEQQLHAHVQAAQAYRLDAESVALYALTAVQLKPGATQDAPWHALMQRAGQQGLLLADQLATLADDFWARWSLWAEEDDNDWPAV